MVAAAPFRGLRFDPAVVGDPALVIAPPYDVIGPEARGAYEAMSPYNMVRLILPRPGEGGQDGYRPAGRLLARWRSEGALRLDTTPSLYVYEETYTLRGERRVQRGVLASVTLDDTATWVLPHERTMAAPVADRLRLLEATGVNLSPVFGVYAGQGRAAAALAGVTATPPALDCVDDAGVGHRLWPVSDPEPVAAWCELLADRRVLIADGHHRYRTSLAYRDAMRAAHPGRGGPWDELLMLLVDADLHGPAVLAIHRLLAGPDGAAVLTRPGSSHGLKQVGTDDLVIAETHGAGFTDAIGTTTGAGFDGCSKQRAASVNVRAVAHIFGDVPERVTISVFAPFSIRIRTVSV